MKRWEIQNNLNKCMHHVPEKVIQQDCTWMPKRNDSLQKLMKWCNVFPIFTKLGAEGKFAG